MGNLLWLVQDRCPAIHHAFLIGGYTAGHDQGDTGSGPFGIECCHTLGAIRQFFQAGVHRAHQHPIFQGGEAEIQRRKQVGVSTHCSLHNIYRYSFDDHSSGRMR
ncbi:hypothetical protein D3C78_1745040 [compost metagenome]